MKRPFKTVISVFSILSVFTVAPVMADNSPPTTALPSKSANAWDQPKFELKGLDGKTHSLDEWKGKVIMLNFWASWCGPCQYEIPRFVKYQNEYGDAGLQIVGLGVDDETRLRNVARTLGINYPVLVASPTENLDLLRQWGNEKQYVPYTVVIRKDGRITYINRGTLDDEAFKEYVKPLIDQTGGDS